MPLCVQGVMSCVLCCAVLGALVLFRYSHQQLDIEFITQLTEA